MMKISGFADEVSLGLKGQLEFLRSQDINFIELRFVDGKNILDLSADELKVVKRMLGDYNIRVSAIASPIGKIRIDEPFEPHLDKFKHAKDLASIFDTQLIRVFSYYAPEDRDIEQYRMEVMERMQRKANVLTGSQILMVHENEAGIYGHSAKNCLDIVQSVSSPQLKLAYDPANFVWGEKIVDNMNTCWPLLKSYVTHIHIKDWKLGSKDNGCLPGDGDGQIAELIEVLFTKGYEGFITLEPHLGHGGQFGGTTGTAQFAEAINRVKSMIKKNTINIE